MSHAWGRPGSLENRKISTMSPQSTGVSKFQGAIARAAAGLPAVGGRSAPCPPPPTAWPTRNLIRPYRRPARRLTVDLGGQLRNFDYVLHTGATRLSRKSRNFDYVPLIHRNFEISKGDSEVSVRPTGSRR